MDVLIYDIETIKGCFLLSVYDPKNDRYIDFTINQYENNLFPMLKYIDDNRDKWWVGYNNLSFDSQVIQYISKCGNEWANKSNLEISSLIWENSQLLIENSKFNLFPPFREDELITKQIDLFKIAHFDNKNRMVSLKRLEFEMDLENIEEFNISHEKEEFSKEEVLDLVNYCHNDVFATYQFYLIIIGQTEHPLYKENNQLQLRLDIEEEFGIKCINYSDSKIGDEIIKKYYCEEKGIDYKDLPKKGFFRKEIKIKHCIADYVQFQTPQLKAFLEKIKKGRLHQDDDFKETIEFYGNTYSFMKGGAHTEQSAKIYEASDDILIVDYDVSSFYPAIIINNNKFPYHLGKEFLNGYKRLFNKRLELKPLSKNNKRIKGIVDALKLSVNAVYGKSSDMQSWMYDRQLTMFTTITGELSLLMLIEAYEINGIKVISANTDGVTLQINKELLPKVEEINNWWMKTTNYELERTDYKKMIFSTVNDYLAIKTDESVKKKGDFLTEFELHKNKSFSIIPLALEKYFVEGVNPEEFILSYKNVFDFCARAKSTKDFHYEGIKDGKISIYNKLIRYYISKDGEKLYKVKNPECTTNAAKISEVNAGRWVSTVVNKLPKSEFSQHLQNIDYSFYIEKVEEMIFKIEKGRKPKKNLINNKNQINLF